MGKKVTWNMIYKDFRQRHPNLKKEVIYWCPCDYATIELRLKDGSRMRYDFMEHTASFVSHSKEEK